MTQNLPQDYTDPLSLAQILGYVAMALGILASLFKCDTRMRLSFITMDIFLITHFVMIGAYAGAVNAFLAGSRAFLSLFDHFIEKRRTLTVFYVLITIILFALTYQRPIDIFPLLAGLNATYAFFYLQGIKLRLSLAACSGLWLIHNIFALSYGPALMELFIMSAHTVTVARLYKEEKASN